MIYVFFLLLIILISGILAAVLINNLCTQPQTSDAYFKPWTWSNLYVPMVPKLIPSRWLWKTFNFLLSTETLCIHLWWRTRLSTCYFSLVVKGKSLMSTGILARSCALTCQTEIQGNCTLLSHERLCVCSEFFHERWKRYNYKWCPYTLCPSDLQVLCLNRIFFKVCLSLAEIRNTALHIKVFAYLCRSWLPSSSACVLKWHK